MKGGCAYLCGNWFLAECAETRKEGKERKEPGSYSLALPVLFAPSFTWLSQHLPLACYTLNGSLEWVGRLLALLFVISNSIFEIRVERERKVRTPQGNGLANSQAERPDDKCNRKETSRWLFGDQVMGETVG